MSKISTFALLAVALPLAAFAGPGKPGPGNQKPISFDEMKARCERPRDFDEQIQPEDLTIQCTDVRHGWVATDPGEVPLSGDRKITTGVFSRKWFVNADQKLVPTYQKGGTCSRFKEVEESFTFEVKMDCGGLTKMSDPSQFCAERADQAKGSNPKLVDSRDTGRVIDTCGQGQGKPGNGKQ